MTIVSAKT